MSNDNQSAAADSQKQSIDPKTDHQLVPVTLPLAQWKLVISALGNAGTFNQMAPLVTTLHQQIMAATGNRQHRRSAERGKK